MNYIIDIQKFLSILDATKGNPSSLPKDVFSLVKLGITGSKCSYDDEVLKKMFNGLTEMLVLMPYTFQKDNGISKVEDICFGIATELDQGAIPSAEGIINYALSVVKDIARSQVHFTYSGTKSGLMEVAGLDYRIH